MIRVVLDTNIIVSALLQPLGPPAQVFACEGWPDSIVRQWSVFAEYEEVISRPRFRRSEAVIAGALDSIREMGLWVRPSVAIRACSDPDDDIFWNVPTRHTRTI
jgi:putative PIN family toxin of toxin-antitoxin system